MKRQKASDADQTTKVIPVVQNGENTKKASGSEPDKDSIDASNKALFEEINSYRKNEMTENEYWERIFYVHLKTKELYILGPRNTVLNFKLSFCL